MLVGGQQFLSCVQLPGLPQQGIGPQRGHQDGAVAGRDDSSSWQQLRALRQAHSQALAGGQGQEGNGGGGKAVPGQRPPLSPL